MPPSKNTSDRSAHGATRKNSIPRSSKEFIQTRIDSIISSRLLGQTEEQSASEADQLNHVEQREQDQHIDLHNSCSSHDASNLSADVVDMVKRLKLARQRQQQQEQDEHIVLTGTKHPRYCEHHPGEVKTNRMSAFCEGCLRKQDACVCNESESYHTIAIDISEDTEAVVAPVSINNQNLFAAAVDDNTESTLDDVRLEGIEHAVESAGINQLVTAKVKKKTKSLIAVEVNEENNDSHQHTDTFRWRAFVIVALLLLIVSILIGLLFALARPRRTQP